MGILTDERAALKEYERLFAPGSSEGPKHLRRYGALGLRRGRALARRQIPWTWRQCTHQRAPCQAVPGLGPGNLVAAVTRTARWEDVVNYAGACHRPHPCADPLG